MLRSRAEGHRINVTGTDMESELFEGSATATPTAHPHSHLHSESHSRIPNPPRALKNLAWWILLTWMLVILIITVAFGFQMMSTVSMYQSLALPKSGDGPPSIANLMTNLIQTDTGASLLKKVLVLLSQEVVDRVLLFDPDGKPASLLLDVSGHGEFKYIWKHMSTNNLMPKSKIIVDVGANDGILGSNSYNFLQMGWKGILVEPYPSVFEELVQNVHQFGPRVKCRQVAVSDYNGEGNLAVFGEGGDPAKLSSTLVDTNQKLGADVVVPKTGSIKVQVRRASEFLTEEGVPHDFGVLSVDAEGLGPKITKDILVAGFRPRYMIWEWLGTKEAERNDLEQYGYMVVDYIGINILLEYTPDKDAVSAKAK